MDDATLKVNWAAEHVKELDLALNEFLKPNRYKVLSKRKARTGEVIYYLAEKRDVPPHIVLRAGDILQNLRTALDYAVYAIIRSRNGRIARNIGFPIFDEGPTTSDNEAHFLGKMQGAGDPAIDYIRNVKPYKAGNEVIWRLHRLNIIAKHRLLLTAGLAMHEFNVGQHMRATRKELMGGVVPDMWVAPRGKLILHDVGDELVIDPMTAEVNENIEFKFAIGFDESPVVEGEPFINVIRQSLDWVTGIVLDLGRFIV